MTVVLAPGLVIGVVCSLGAIVAIYGVQPGLNAYDHAAPFAMKLGYAGPLALLALSRAAALARPAQRVPNGWWSFAPLGMIAVFAAVNLAQTPFVDWPQALLGGSWDRCPWRIFALSLPTLASLMVIVRGQAPTDLIRAGLAIGLASGATASVFYALACTENSAAFVFIWYTFGITLSGGFGASLGPRALRWY